LGPVRLIAPSQKGDHNVREGPYVLNIFVVYDDDDDGSPEGCLVALGFRSGKEWRLEDSGLLVQ
jgi:hypothetical protein